jgi:cytoplasmic iron level regulating protein YaaA (DUF328/UPF0246 family)
MANATGGDMIDFQEQLEDVIDALGSTNPNDVTELVNIAADLQGITNALMQYVRDKMEKKDGAVQTQSGDVDD